MKHLLITFCLVFGVLSNAFSQGTKLFDQNSRVGTVMVVPAIDYSNAINKYYFNKKAFDKLVDYMRENKTVYIEVNCFSDFTEVPLMNLMATKDQANDIRTYLVSKGIEGSRIKTVGSGDMFPIHSEDEINRMSETKKKEANLANRRIEIKIIKKG